MKCADTLYYPNVGEVRKYLWPRLSVTDWEFMELYWHIDTGLNIGNFLHFYFYLLYSKPKYQPNTEFSSSGLHRNVPTKFYLHNIQGVPEKTLFCVQRLLEALKNDLQIKVGWVLKNSGNFQSIEHKNFVFLPKNAWDIRPQSWLPSSWNNAF